MRTGRDGTGGAVRAADGPELGKGRGAIDGGLLDAHLGADFILAVVRRHVAQPLDRRVVARARLVRAVPLDNVPLHQRIARPPVERDVGVAIALDGALVADVPERWDRVSESSRGISATGWSMLPGPHVAISLAAHKVSLVTGPADIISTAATASAAHLSDAIAPVLKIESESALALPFL